MSTLGVLTGALRVPDCDPYVFYVFYKMGENEGRTKKAKEDRPRGEAGPSHKGNLPTLWLDGRQRMVLEQAVAAALTQRRHVGRSFDELGQNYGST